MCSFFSLTGMLLRYFVNFYDMEIIEEEAFLAWKEDVTQEFPGKGKALFQVQNLTIQMWLAVTPLSVGRQRNCIKKLHSQFTERHLIDF